MRYTYYGYTHYGLLTVAHSLWHLLWREADARPVGAAAVIGTAVGGGGRPSNAHEFRQLTRLQDLPLELRDLSDGDCDAARLGQWVLPQLRGWYVTAQATRAWSHVTVGQLVPGQGSAGIEQGPWLG